MLEGAPWLLAHKSMLQKNKPFKVSLYGKDYVIWQDNSGNISALSNVCPHMGAMLSEGWCEEQADGTSKIVCPYHALEFDESGCTILPGSNKKTLSQVQPLELIIQDDFIWSYGDSEPKIPIPNILEQINQDYEFVGFTADTSVETDLRSMLLIMHDYNHQNGTHKDLFEITEVDFQQFIHEGYHSEAFFYTPTAPKTFWQKLQQPKQFLIPDLIEAHLDNYFPNIVILYTGSPLGEIAQCHFFVPESKTTTRTYVLLFGKSNNPFTRFVSNQFLEASKIVVEQDVAILNKIYTNNSKKIKLNNEVGMDWVNKNFDAWQ